MHHITQLYLVKKKTLVGLVVEGDMLNLGSGVSRSHLVKVFASVACKEVSVNESD